MPFLCSVPNCFGNYSAGPKVSVFLFPKDKKLCQKWLDAIERGNFTITKNSRVCELHFLKEDVERNTIFHSAGGDTYEVPLKVPRIRKGAVPCIFSVYPNNIPNKTPIPIRIRAKQTKKIICHEQTISDSQSIEKLDDIVRAFNNIKLPLWNMIETFKYVTFIYIEEAPHPTIHSTVSINANMNLSIYYQNTPIKSLVLNGSVVKLPIKITTANLLKEILSETQKMLKNVGVEQQCNMAVDILDCVAKELPYKARRIQLLQKQIKLLNN